MDLWISRDAERPVAAVASFFAVLLPWDVTYLGDIAGGELIFFRFPLLEFQWARGIQALPAIRIRHVKAAYDLHVGGPLQPAYVAYAVGGAFVVLALILAVGLVLAQPRQGGLDPTKVVGGLLVVAGAAFLVGWYVILTRGSPGIDIPFGATLTAALGLVLVFAERR
jgi:hypothetical protein